MEIENEIKTEKFSLPQRQLIFFLILAALVGFALLRSSMATRLDGLTLDEGYHIGAGVAYVQTGDFRLNPEHPPLVKLWTGAFVSGIYQTTPYRVLKDKSDERNFVEEDIYIKNDPDVIQSRSRIAMFAFNGLLLVLFAWSVRRVFGDVMAFAATAFLVIDPTVAAHLPAVMTDLPVALLSTSAVLLAVAAFRSWRAVDLIFAALALGLALGAKHSAVITMAAIALLGIVMAILGAREVVFAARLRRAGLVALVLIGALVVLWSFYLFRFNESPGTSEERFNRSLAEKISDVNSPRYRAGLNFMAVTRLFPRAYTWGMADTIRAGAEGRARSVFAFGNRYQKAPFYFFAGVIAVKLPLGLLFLTALGFGILVARKVPREFFAPLLGVLGLAVIFLIVLSTGSAYAGIRHALPVVPPLALLGALGVYKALESGSKILRAAVAAAVLGALLSAIPVLRPWEYYNETVGTAKAYQYFNDEGIDITLRTKELEKYYNENLKPAGEIPYIVYPMRITERKGRKLDWIGREDERDAEKIDSEILSGTIFVGARQVRGKPAFRDAVPIARFGNLFVFRGTFFDPDTKVLRLINRANNKIYSAEPDIEGAIKLLSEAVALDPKKFHIAVELGNQYLKVGKREDALRIYQIARENAPATEDIGELLTRQIERLRTEPLEQILPLRNPKIE